MDSIPNRRWRGGAGLLKGLAVAVVCAIILAGTVMPAFAASVVVGGGSQVIDDTDSRFAFSSGNANNGGWDAGGSGSPEATEHWTNTPGASLDISFNGTGFSLYGIKDPNHRYIKVAVDGKNAQEVDCYSADRASDVELYRVDGLKKGDHIAHVELLEKANPSINKKLGVSVLYAVARGIQVDMDTAVPTQIDDSIIGDGSFQFDYKGNWIAEDGYPQLFHDGTDHYSQTVGDSWSMKFTGPKIDVYGTVADSHGIYAVQIDGVKKDDIDATGAQKKHKQLLGSYTGLDPKAEHTITVSLKSGSAIQIDNVVVERKPLAASDFTLTPAKQQLESGSTFKLSYAIAPQGAVDPGVTYEFDDKVLTIDGDGVVSAKAVTKKTVATVTAKLNGADVTRTCEVTVYPRVTSFNAFVGDEKLLDTQEDWEDKKADHTDSWSDVAWLGDERSSKIGIATRDDGAKNVRIVAGDLISQDGSKISGKDIEVKWLRNVSAKEGRNAQGRLKSFPEIIYYDNTGLDVPANTLQYAWLTIPVPVDAKPGVYNGTMQVVADGVEACNLAYTLEVIGLKQPTADEVGYEVQIWQHPFSVSGYYFANSTADAATGTGTDAPIGTFMSEEHKDLLRGSLKEYASIGGHDLVANIVEEAWNHQSYFGDSSMVTWILNDKGEWSFDYTLFDKWIDFATECGVIDPATDLGQIKCYSMVSWGSFKYKDAETGEMKSYDMQLNGNNPKAEAAWSAFLKDFYKHCTEKGVWDITYISMDERDYSQLKPVVDLVAKVEGELGTNIKLSSALNVGTDQNILSLSDKIDDISVQTSHTRPIENFRKLCDERAAKGLVTTVYNCTGNYPGNFMISDPGDNYWVTWYAMSSHADGFMRWAWDNWTNDMFGNATYRYWEPGDGWYIYPLEKASDLAENPDGFYSTPRYEMFKQGIRDVCKAKYLAQDDALSARVTELVDSLRYPQQGSSVGNAVPLTQQQRMLTHSETDRMYDGINEIAREVQVVPNPKPEVNKGELQALVDEALKAETTGKTESVVNAFNKALATAQDVLADKDATQQQVDDAYAKLSAALKALKADGGATEPQPEQKPEGGQSKPGTDGSLAQTGDPALLALVATGALGAGAVAAGCRARKRSR